LGVGETVGDGDTVGVGDGETVGVGEGVGVFVGDGDTVGVGDGDTVGVGDGETVGVGEGVGDGVGVGVAPADVTVTPPAIRPFASRARLIANSSEAFVRKTLLLNEIAEAPA